MKLSTIGLCAAICLNPIEANSRIVDIPLSEMVGFSKTQIQQRVIYVLNSQCGFGDDGIIHYNHNSDMFEICDYHTRPANLDGAYSLGSEIMKIGDCFLYNNNHEILCSLGDETNSLEACFSIDTTGEPHFPRIINGTCEQVRIEGYQKTEN